MSRDEWMATLAPLIRPRAPLPAATQLGNMLRFLGDIPDVAFTEASLSAIAPKLPRSPSYPQMRAALDHYVRSLAPQPERTTDDSETMRERRRLAERDRLLAQDWDNPVGIRGAIRTCDGDPRFLRMLAALVQRHAPQHLGLLPPAAISTLDDADPEPFRAPIAPPRPAYLTPEQLRTVGVTHGQTIAPSSDATAAAIDSGSAASMDFGSDELGPRAAYPDRDDA
jgi:hypothetical protein